MKFKSLLSLVLIAGLFTPAAYAQNAGFAAGIQRPINPPVPPMTRPPVAPTLQPPVPPVHSDTPPESLRSTAILLFGFVGFRRIASSVLNDIEKRLKLGLKFRVALQALQEILWAS